MSFSQYSEQAYTGNNILPKQSKQFCITFFITVQAVFITVFYYSLSNFLFSLNSFIIVQAVFNTVFYYISNIFLFQFFITVRAAFILHFCITVQAVFITFFFYFHSKHFLLQSNLFLLQFLLQSEQLFNTVFHYSSSIF